ncbi:MULTISPECIES: DUF2207 domain-containing protein [Nonomuraea]|uniref:DUF2207 domain-containing protein n=1 Tax=Nonomuraea TaxID=83681 RepID=UPI001C6015E2|nr:DUF2207 domain-containing protein [Nonomuraea ceibae]
MLLMVLAAGLLPQPVAGPHVTQPRAEITATVRADGTVAVVEEHTLTYRSPGKGAYVDIPRAPGVVVEDVSVRESAAYEQVAPAEPDSSGRAGTYSERACGTDGPHRVVWHLAATPGSTRTFRLGYTLKNAVTVFGGHAFLHLPVRGAHWRGGVDLLEVTVRLPGPPGSGGHQAFGQPASRLAAGPAGQVTRASARAVPGAQALALDLAFPPARLDLPSTGGKVLRGEGDGSATLAELRAGRQPVTSAGGAACGPVGTETYDGTWWVFAGMAVLVTGVLVIVERRARRPLSRRSGPARGRAGRSYSDHGYHAGQPGGTPSHSPGEGGGGGGGSF